MSNEPLLDALDIQGNIIPGFRRKHQYFVGFTANDNSDLRRAVAVLTPMVTPLADVLDYKGEMKQRLRAGQDRPERPELWLNLGIGPRALSPFDLEEVRGLDLAFSAGMVPARTGDPTNRTLPDGRPNPAHPANWVVGGPSKPLDLLLIFSTDIDIEAQSEQILGRLSAFTGLNRIYTERADLLPGDVEHFGFQDGVSQPGPRGAVIIDGRQSLITSRYGVPSRSGMDFGRPGQPLVWPGQFVIGTPTGPDEQDDVPQWVRNGSFMVFRRLSQDVKAFYLDTESMAQQLSARLGRALSAQELRALIVGRWPSGQPLMRPTQGDPSHPEELEPVREAINYFVFGTQLPDIVLDGGTRVPGAEPDPGLDQGVRCPVWAHIRKVNPRDLGTDRGGPAETLSFQMLRRGTPFGPQYNHHNPSDPVNEKDRGLLFVSYQSSISKQFESLNTGWMNQNELPKSHGFDLLVGQKIDPNTRLHAPKDADFIPSPNANAIHFEAAHQWVTPTGGAYLFAPSINAIRRVASSVETV